MLSDWEFLELLSGLIKGVNYLKLSPPPPPLFFFLHFTFSFQSRSWFPPQPSLSPQIDMDQYYNKHTEGRQLPTCQNESLRYLMCCRDSAAQNRMNHVCPLKLNQIQYSLSRAIHHSEGQRDCHIVQYTGSILKRTFSLCNLGWTGRP